MASDILVLFVLAEKNDDSVRAWCVCVCARNRRDLFRQVSFLHACVFRGVHFFVLGFG